MYPHESKEYSWAWVTADQLLSHGPCDLLYANMRPSAENDIVTLYDGENTSGGIVAILQGAYDYGAAVQKGQSVSFSPPVPVYCRMGLYVDLGATATRVFVQWRELGHKAGG